MDTHSKNKSTQRVSCTFDVHEYFHIKRNTPFCDIKKSFALQIQHTHIHILSPLSLSLSLSPLPYWTGQLDGLQGMVERLYKEGGFEAGSEGSKRRRLTDCKWKRVPDGASYCGYYHCCPVLWINEYVYHVHKLLLLTCLQLKQH